MRTDTSASTDTIAAATRGVGPHDDSILPFTKTLEKTMKSIRLLLALSVFACGSVWAADTNTYQVTGPVLSMTPTSITVQKDKEKWEIARDQATPVKGDLKVGSKVTIKYRMTAVSVEVKK